VRLSLIGIALIALSYVDFAYADGADWKLYGWAGTKEDVKELFFLSSEVRRNSKGNVEVWTKAIRDSDFERFYSKPADSDFTYRLAVKKASGYVPPIEAVLGRKVSEDERLDIMMAEDIANEGLVATESKTLYEIQCSANSIRILSTVKYKDSAVESRSEPSKWMPIPPETNGQTLAKLLCRTRNSRQ